MKRRSKAHISSGDLAPVERVSLRSQGYSEAWLEQQIINDPGMLRLSEGNMKVVRPQLRQDKERRLDLLLKAADEDTYYSVELMLGELNASHLVRTIDYWLRNMAALDEDWDHVAVAVAERISETNCRRVARWLAEVAPFVAIELRAIRVDGRLAIEPVTVFDGRDHQEALDLDRPQVELGRDYWLKKASVEMVDLAEDMASVLPKLDPKLRLSYRQGFWGVTAQGGPANFISFSPKKNFVKATARVEDAEGWAKRLKKTGLDVVRIRAGRSVQFKVPAALSSAQRKVWKEMCQVAFGERFPDLSDN
jgi:hypothetical protein